MSSSPTARSATSHRCSPTWTSRRELAADAAWHELPRHPARARPRPDRPGRAGAAARRRRRDRVHRALRRHRQVTDGVPAERLGCGAVPSGNPDAPDQAHAAGRAGLLLALAGDARPVAARWTSCRPTSTRSPAAIRWGDFEGALSAGRTGLPRGAPDHGPGTRALQAGPDHRLPRARQHRRQEGRRGDARRRDRRGQPPHPWPSAPCATASDWRWDEAKTLVADDGPAGPLGRRVRPPRRGLRRPSFCAAAAPGRQSRPVFCCAMP